MLILLLLYSFLEGLLDAIRDTINHHWTTSVFWKIKHPYVKAFFESHWLNRWGQEDKVKANRFMESAEDAYFPESSLLIVISLYYDVKVWLKNWSPIRDMWHLGKTISTLLTYNLLAYLYLELVYAKVYTIPYTTNNFYYDWLVLTFVLGALIRNQTFKLFYQFILYRK